MWQLAQGVLSRFAYGEAVTETGNMAKAKGHKKARPHARVTTGAHNGHGGSAASAAVADSDSDLEGVLPGATFTVGSSAYETLIGSFDKPPALAGQHDRLRQKRRKELRSTGVPEQTQQQGQAQQGAVCLVSAPQAPVASAEGTPEHDDAGASMAEVGTADQAGQAPADHFTEHFQQAAPEQGNHVHGPDSEPALQPKGEVHKAAWPNAEWVNVGQHFPQVSHINWPLATAGPPIHFIMHMHSSCTSRQMYQTDACRRRQLSDNQLCN